MHVFGKSKNSNLESAFIKNCGGCITTALPSIIEKTKKTLTGRYLITEFLNYG